MNGSDHLLPQPGLGAVVAAANDAQSEFQFEVTSLTEYLARQPVDGLPTWSGELRSGARANLLMGVASNRVDVHQAAARAERTIERIAEPLAALFLPSSERPDAFLELAWNALVLNSAHDSSCACSADEVVDQVLVRYADARQIGEGLADLALAAFAADTSAAPGAIVVVNPTQSSRGGIVTCTVAGQGPAAVQRGDGAMVATQVVARHTPDVFTTTVTGRKVGWVLDLIRGPEIMGTRIARVERTRHLDGTEELHFIGTRDAGDAIDLEHVREEIRALGEQGATVRIRVSRPPEHDIAFAVDPVAGFGWDTYRILDPQLPPMPGAAPVTTASVVATETALSNGLVRVEIDPDRNGFSVEADGVRVDGLGRLVDGGDGGDTYSYSPPADDVEIDAPISSEVGVLEGGPVRGRLFLDRSYRWPAAAVGDERSCSRRSNDTVDVTVRTTLEVRAGERFVRVRTEFENRSRDHRLRAHFPLPARVDGSDAECAFTVVHRGLDAEGGPHEAPLPTFVSRRFVDASDGAVGLAVLHDGLLEYEVVDDGSELALTLLRATGYLSRAEPSLRPDPAGPLDPLLGPQLLGPISCGYAVMPHRGDWDAADLYARADEFLVPLASTRASGSPGFRPESGRALEVSGAVVSALHRVEGALTVRAFNPTTVATHLRVARDGVPVAGQVVDLVGRPVADFAGAADLRAGEIITLRLG